VKTTRRLLGKTQLVLVRAASVFYGRGPVGAAVAGGAAPSLTVRLDERVKAAITSIPDAAWTAIEYPDAVLDTATGRWISSAEVAEVAFNAFAAEKNADHVPARLVVRRIPDFNAEKNKAGGQDTLFDTWPRPASAMAWAVDRHSAYACPITAPLQFSRATLIVASSSA
jgi:hypothetical protein